MKEPDSEQISSPKADSYVYLLVAICLLQMLTELGPFFFIPSLLTALNWETNVLPSGDLNSAYLVTVCVVWAETLLLVAFFSLVRSLSSYLPRFVGIVLLTLLYGAGSLYYGIVLGSWWSYIEKGTFVQVSDLSLLSYLLDPVVLFHSASPHEFNAIAGMILGGIILFTLTCAFFPCPKSMEHVAVHALMLGTTCLLIGYAYYSKFDSPQRFRDFTRFLGTYAAPRVSLYQSAFVEEAEPSIVLDLDGLPKAESTAEYGSRIPVEWKPKRNFLVIVVEALRHDMLDEAETMPEVREIASDGVSFPWAYATAPETAYAQSTLITGQHPLKFPTRDLFLDLDYPFFRIYDVMKVAGYSTGYFTTEWGTSIRLSESPNLDIHLDPGRSNRSPENTWIKSRGQDLTWNNEVTEIDAINTRELKNWIQHQQEKPFFALIYLVSSHSPYVLTVDDAGQDLTHSDSVLDAKERYRICLQRIDRYISDIVTHLKNQNLADRTTIIITGDHGEGFGEHGITGHPGPLIEELVRVPLIFSPKFPIPAPQSIAVSHLDIPPTILALAGLPPTEAFQGTSLIAQESKNLSERPVFLTQQMLSREDTIIVFPHKYTWDLRREMARMYNLQDDPHELNNLIGKMPSVEEMLSGRLEKFRAEQLAYYRLPGSIRRQYFAPRIFAVNRGITNDRR